MTGLADVDGFKICIQETSRYSSVGRTFVWCTRDRGFKPNQCLLTKYVEENSLAAMLATKRSAGVAPEVNLRTDVTRSLKQGYQGPHKKDLRPPNI